MASKTDAAKNVKLVSLDSKGVRSQYFSVKLIFYTLIFGPQDHLRAAEKSDRFLGVFRFRFPMGRHFKIFPNDKGTATKTASNKRFLARPGNECSRPMARIAPYIQKTMGTKAKTRAKLIHFSLVIDITCIDYDIAYPKV
jgi:hypothetical protein